ncbi:MAG: ArnT family glycosyltransferase [Nitrospinales bacterium]
MPLTQLLKNQTFQIMFIFYSGLMLFLGRINHLGLRNFDDAHYAQVAKEILTTGSVWILHFNNLPKFEKPPLPFWVMALSYKLFGVSEYSAIFPLAISGVLTVFLTYKITELLFKDRWVAFFAAFILLFPGYFFSHSRRVTMDIILTFCVTGASFSLLKALVNPKYYLFFGLFTAGAVLSKGLPGLIPLLIGPGYLLLTKRFKEFRNPYFVWGILIALVVRHQLD